MSSVRNHALEGLALSTLLALVLAGCAGSEGGESSLHGPPGESAAGSLGNARAALGANPAGVPEDFIITPMGYMHPSCVIPTGTSDTVLEDGSIQSADGSVRATPPCGFPRFDANGAPLTTETGGLIRSLSVADGLSFTGWVEAAHDDSMGPLSFLSTRWTVPSPPSANVGQTIFYFPGIQPLEQRGSEYTILQPVLAWRGEQWLIESWNCCTEGNANTGPVVPVSPGDSIFGSIEGSNCDESGVCSNWVVDTLDTSTGAESRLDTTAYGNVMGWAFGGVLEVYDVSACDQYPEPGSVTFSELDLRSTGGASVQPTWQLDVTAEPPQCGYGVEVPDPSTVTVFASPF